jgi:large subunit ribosomal protein L4
MAKISLYNINGNSTGDMEVNDTVFSIEPNQAVIQEVVLALMANKRQGTACTKRRDEVRGGGKKPWKQKGTGNARTGSTRSPVWVGGGSVFGPKPRSYYQKLTSKKKQLALRSALTERLRDGDLVVVDSFDVQEPKTKPVIELMDKLQVTQTALIVMDTANENFIKSARNIPFVKLCVANNINTYDLLRFQKVIFEKAALSKVEKSLME